MDKISPAKITPFPKNLTNSEQFYQLLNAVAPLVFYRPKYCFFDPS